MRRCSFLPKGSDHLCRVWHRQRRHFCRRQVRVVQNFELGNLVRHFPSYFSTNSYNSGTALCIGFLRKKMLQIIIGVIVKVI